MTLMNSQHPDIGILAIKRIHGLLNIDEKWTSWEDRGFSWWPHQFKQRIWSEQVSYRSSTAYRICAETDFFRDISDVVSEIPKIVLMASTSTLTAPILYDKAQKMTLYSSLCIHDDSVFLTALFAMIANIQTIEAELRAPGMAEIYNATPDTSPHPINGNRPDLDDQLYFLERVVVPKGRKPSPWRKTDEFKKAAELIHERSLTSLVNESNPLFVRGIECDRSSLSAIFYRDYDNNDGIILKAFGDVSHPQLGNGLMLQLYIPKRIVKMQEDQWILKMNLDEKNSHSHADFIGSWARNANKKEQSLLSIAFITFIPAVFCQHGVLIHFVEMNINRAQWLVNLHNLSYR